MTVPLGAVDVDEQATPDGSDARGGTWLLVVLLVIFVSRFMGLRMDAPYGIISNSGAFLTDEGWYAKSAVLHARFGEWTSLHDIVWYSHNVLYTFVLSSVFRLFEVGLGVARAVSVVCSIGSLCFFYGICRTVQPRRIALLAAVLVSITLTNFAYSRMALVEPMGTLFTLGAIWAWVRFPSSWGARLAALVLAAAAFFAKAWFVYAVITVVALLAGEAWWRSRRENSGRTAWMTGTVVVAAVIALALLFWTVVAWTGSDGAFFSALHVGKRFEGLGLLGILKHELRMLLVFVERVGAPALVGAVVGGVGLLVFRRRFPRPSEWSRATVGMVVLIVCGCGFIGLFDYRPARYFYFALYPTVFLALQVARRLVGARAWLLAGVMLLAVHGAVQVPDYVNWGRRRTLTSHAAMARDVAARVGGAPESSEPVALMGGLSPYVSLFDDRIRPLAFKWVPDLPALVAHWRPTHLLAFPSAAADLRVRCPELVRGVEPIASYRVLDNYYKDEDQVLYRILYLP